MTTTRERGRNECERESEISVRVNYNLGRAAMATRERGRDERVIERVRKRSGLSYDLG